MKKGNQVILVNEEAKGLFEHMESMFGKTKLFGGTGKLVALEGEDISHIEEITDDTVEQGELVYYDELAQRHFIMYASDMEVSQ